MSEIDWDKAPEGAEFWCDEQWFKNIDGEWFTWYPGALSWAKPAYKAPDNFSWWGAMVERPSSAWNGEGLPPVGTVCEWEHEANKGNWYKAEIKYIGSAYVIVADLAGFEQHYYLRSMKFRPIRTHEQIAADEREAAIKEMIEDAGRPDTAKTRDQAQLLYDAGWRKQPKP